MKIISVQSLPFPEIKVIRFARFGDHRGYFTEHFRKSDFRSNPLTPFMKDVEFLQTNESFSRTGTIRGLHFQWNPYMGKMVRTIQGHMIDLILDIRQGSPHFGKIIAYDMPSQNALEFNEWIWIPPGFAHGNFFPEDSLIEYYCSGEYSQGCEAGISPLAKDIDWSLCDPTLRKRFDQLAQGTPLLTDKDKNGLSVAAWEKDERSRHFVLGKMG
ncbi:MAG TPA: dTDP-4-dehydrorhamnose 3,5-epimerase family protein [Gemmataceae bacterium]|nr:dTDP-4-dehydrorhamnose 3,5-epimerase family protein [Gemmataceae bacterium]